MHHLKHEVLIQICGEQIVEGQSDRVEMAARGTLEELDNGYAVSYVERDGPMEGCMTRLTLDGPRMAMLRTGEYASEMILERGRRHTCSYTTPYGQLMLGVFARQVDYQIQNGDGKIEVSYTLDSNERLASENKLRITLKKWTGEDENRCQN